MTSYIAQGSLSRNHDALTTTTNRPTIATNNRVRTRSELQVI